MFSTFWAIVLNCAVLKHRYRDWLRTECVCNSHYQFGAPQRVPAELKGIVIATDVSQF
jgi:hypothetical protein